MTQILHVPSSDHRWSEMVPPHTALTFAAVWDPLEGMITFSGAHLLDSASATGPNAVASEAPRDAFDSQSQVLTIDALAQALASTAPSTAFMLDNYYSDGYDTQTIDYSSVVPHWVSYPPGTKLSPPSPAFASSIALGVSPPSLLQGNESDYRVLLRTCIEHARLAHSRRQRSEYPRLKTPEICIETATVTDRGDPVVDEGFCESVRLTSRGSFGTAPVLVDLNLKSAFSVTTTSTTNYVEVDFPPDTESALACAGGAAPHDAEVRSSSSWTALNGLERFCFTAPFEQQRRRLKKHRSDGRRSPLVSMHSRSSSSSSSSNSAPASPAEVLAREHYNHVSPSSPPCSPATHSPPLPLPLLNRRKPKANKAEGCCPKTRLFDRLGRVMRHDDEEGWVCVDVTQIVTQRLI
ncbi:hypothetical protein SCP_1503390 [Sparassis crispa]|uniref:Uncharacterized protein n=1 Tax=Sparassis crispa TaxID=139825 RepID=A0A401H4K6_9APHY|nr:hypothetical protein SCP_1503390 [Sparassis crispa]GBE89331.1 hypothetical protein SCP_1503390 [Sparassis crispa]